MPQGMEQKMTGKSGYLPWLNFCKLAASGANSSNECDCRFVMGSNKVLRVALGHGAEDEYKKGLSALAEDISGSIGLFFTRLPQDEVYFECALLGNCSIIEPELAVF